jgi:acyl-CoA oxidase
MEQNFIEFTASGYFAAGNHELLRDEIIRLLAAIRPQAVAIVDGFAFPD